MAANTKSDRFGFGVTRERIRGERDGKMRDEKMRGRKHPRLTRLQMGVASVNLTGQGRKFFREAAALGSFRLQQHHRREVAVAGHGFTALAHGNQCFISQSNAILTFQGHPEKDAETARLRLHDSMRWFGFDAASDEKAWAQLEMLIQNPHDGEMVWRRIFEWVREPCAEAGHLEQKAALALAEKASKM